MKQQIIEEIFSLYENHGNKNYSGERISQLEHMVQAAELAEANGYDDEVILAAFFHDIGHLLHSNGTAETMGDYGVKEHEKVGADFLRHSGFSERMAQLVESHVQAKRYLTFAKPEYYASLSEASKKTLEFQGGPMNADEANAFEQHPLFNLFIAMRLWDEDAKVEHQPMPPLGKYKSMAEKILNA